MGRSFTKQYLFDAPSISFATNTELEDRIRANPDDTSSYLVYADWLTSNGDLRGELAMIQHALSEEPNADKHAALSARQAQIFVDNGFFLAGVSPPLLTTEWHLGTFRSIRLMNLVDSMDASFDSRGIARRLFHHPPTSCLQTLKLGILRWEYQSEDIAAVLEEASKSPFASGLRHLVLGDVEGMSIDNAHHLIGDIGVLNGGAFPRLETLKVWGYEIHSTTPFDLPALKSLVIQTCGLRRDLFESIVVRGKLPSLTSLELWFGSGDYGSQCNIDDLASILDGTAFPRLTHLGLCNAEFAEDILRAVLDSKILPNLESLSLSKGVLADDSGRLLLERRDAWKHLKQLDLEENFLTSDVIELEKVGPTVLSRWQREEEEEEDASNRYVGMRE